MKSVFLVFCCLVMGSGFAEVIDQVEYHLPAVAKEWEVSNKLESKNGTTLIYTPKGVQRQNTEESFGINSNHFPFNPNEVTALQGTLQTLFANLDIDLRVLDKSESSLLYEWSAKEKGVEKVHGFGRALATKDGSFTLTYQTENVSAADKARSVWLPVLKNAHRQ